MFLAVLSTYPGTGTGAWAVVIAKYSTENYKQKIRIRFFPQKTKHITPFPKTNEKRTKIEMFCFINNTGKQ